MYTVCFAQGYGHLKGGDFSSSSPTTNTDSLTPRSRSRRSRPSGVAAGNDYGSQTNNSAFGAAALANSQGGSNNSAFGESAIV